MLQQYNHYTFSISYTYDQCKQKYENMLFNILFDYTSTIRCLRLVDLIFSRAGLSCAADLLDFA